MTFRMAAIAGAALSTLMIGIMPASASTCERSGGDSLRTCVQPVQFDTDEDGVAGCVNKCKLDLEICLGLRQPGESRDACDQLENQCENGCYNTGPDAGKDE